MRQSKVSEMAEKIKTHKVIAKHLIAGDEFPSGIYVTAVYYDPDGTWLETSDGDAGYVQDESKLYEVMDWE